jgi:hypothetical protein
MKWPFFHRPLEVRTTMRSLARRRCRPTFETLEERQTPSALPVGPVFLVNDVTAGNQGSAAIAVNGSGNFVISWTSAPGPGGAGKEVWAQRFNALGQKQGSSLHVNTTTANDQQASRVAIDASGDFVVTWTSVPGQDGSGSGVYAQRFNAAGVKQGLEFRVNTTTAGDQKYADVAMDATGDFVISWTGLDQNGKGVFLQRYTAAGQKLGGEVHVNPMTSGDQQLPDVALDTVGNCVIVYENDVAAASGGGLYVQRYNAAGVSQGAPVLVNTSPSVANARVAMNGAGTFIVTWQGYDPTTASQEVYGRRFNATGQAQGVPFPVNTYTTNAQTFPTAAMDAAGNFLIAWTSQGQDGSGAGVYARRYNAAGNRLGGEFRVNTATVNDQVADGLGMDAAGNFVVAWDSINQDGAGSGVYAQRFQQRGPYVRGVYLPGTTQPLIPGSRLSQPVQHLVVAFSEAPSVAGGNLAAHSVTNLANWQLVKNGTPLAGALAGITLGYNGTTGRYEAVLTFGNPLTDGNYVLVARDSIQGVDGNALDGNHDGVPGGNYTLGFGASRLLTSSGEFQVNTTTNTHQQAPATAMDANGNSVVVWQSNIQDGSSAGIYAQRYSATGAKLGSEFRVNSWTPGSQNTPAVGMNAYGQFVVSWTSYAEDGSLDGVYAQRYDAAGQKLGAEFRVNTTAADDQKTSAVALDGLGNFVITWQSHNQSGNSGWGVYARRYNAQGGALTGEMLVTTTTAADQVTPQVGMAVGGAFAITWASQNQDGSGGGVYVQRFSATGLKAGGEFRVNTTTANNQLNPAIEVDKLGNFVIAWASYGQTGSSWGVFAQRFDLNGNKLGGEFRVNTTTPSIQPRPAVAVDGHGNFIIVWGGVEQYNVKAGIYGQLYNAAGVAQGGEFRINTASSFPEALPSVTMNANGGFQVVWESFEQDSSGWGVFGQRYRV